MLEQSKMRLIGNNMNGDLVDQVATAKGIETKYVNAWGQEAVVDPASNGKLLAAMGYSVENEAEFTKELEQEASRYWLNCIDPVKIVRQQDSIEFEFRVVISEANDTFKCVIEVEQGQPIEYKFIPVEGTLVDVAEFDELEYQEYLVSIQATLPCGYHSLSVYDSIDQHMQTQSLIVAPAKCYVPPTLSQREKAWGTSVQLYCVRSERNWGMGDFSDLQQIIGNIADNGGDFIGLNPIHALSPAQPDHCSPYSPSSRRWLNIFYIDPESVDGYAESTRIKSIIESPSHQALKLKSKQADYVDYQAVSALKIPVFKILYEKFKAKHIKHNTQTGLKFLEFVKLGADSLRQLAVYDAIQAHLLAETGKADSWLNWPEQYRDYQSDTIAEFTKTHTDSIQFYMYLQWVAACQLAQCQNIAIEKGMKLGIYRDLAVGVSLGSAEVWANPDLYCKEISVGAPPDPLGPQGQSWGLPPMEPNQLFQQKYQPIIDLYRANMQSCGALRIDHVMALLRLWWVPAQEHATKGAFVYYPIDDLLALLCLESQRNQCMIIGEDLGTVPDGIRDTLKENAVLSYRVFFFETAPDGGFYSPEHYPEQAMATLTTHDMPTLKGFWHCDDLRLGDSLGIYTDKLMLDGLFHARHHAKQRILDSLHGHHSINTEISKDAKQVGMDQSLNYAMQVHLAGAHSMLLSLQLEDWLEMALPVNVPGTCDEYPNWRRKLSLNLEDLFKQPHIKQLMSALTHKRQSV